MAIKTKKVILFIVEGPTDENTLSPVLKKLFHSENVHFHVVHGDMMAKFEVSPENAIVKVNERIKHEMHRYGFKKQDIVKVIHLVDTDGVFIPESAVVFEKVDHIQYKSDCILSSNPEGVIERNQRKSMNLQRLYSAKKVAAIPYFLYYFSRNLEQVLQDVNADLTDEEKVEYADEFADKLGSDPNSFKEFISSKDFAVEGDYKETWEFIMEDVNSLNRYCNLHLLFINVN